MPLDLVTGPANAAKAGVILGEFRKAAESGAAPVLVVPTKADRDAYEQEILVDGSLIGGRVMAWEGLSDLLARRTGIDRRLIGPLRRRTLLRAATAGCLAGLGPLARSAATPGFTGALEAVIRELGRAGVDAAALELADRPAPSGRKQDLIRLMEAYEAALEHDGVVDREHQGIEILKVLEADPGLWDGRPVLVYGFTDLTVAQQRVLVALAQTSVVTVSLPADGRDRVGVAASVVAALRDRAANITIRELPPEAGLEGPQLLEQALFSDAGNGVAAGAARSVELLEASGTVAAAEMVAAEVARLHVGGTPIDSLVVVRPAAVEDAPLRAALREAGFEVSSRRATTLGATALGRALIGLIRCELAVTGASTADAVAWIGRVAGRDGRARIERLDAASRRRGDDDPAGLVAEWERESGGPAPLSGLFTNSMNRNAFAEALREAARGILDRSLRSRGAMLDEAEGIDAAALRSVLIGAADIAELGGEGDRSVMIEELSALPVEVSDGSPAAGAVLISDPVSIRGRNFDAVIVCGLEDGVFPARFNPGPFLGEVAPEAVAGGGSTLTASERHAALERERFTNCVARARRSLTLTRRQRDDAGEELARSPFVDEAMRLLGRSPAAPDAVRAAGSVGGSRSAGLRDGRRAQALAEPRREPLASPLRLGERARSVIGQDLDAVISPSRLESYARCPCDWLAGAVLGPREIEPESDPVDLGNTVHDALEQAINAVLIAGFERVDSDSIGLAREAARKALDARAKRRGDSVSASVIDRRARTMVDGWLEAELERDLPWHLVAAEMKFGRDGEIPPLDLGEGLKVAGRVDLVERVGTDAGERVVIRDFKTGSSSGAVGEAAERWAAGPTLQAPLYLMAAASHCAIPAGGAVYEALRTGGRLGALAESIDVEGGFSDRVSDGELQKLLDDAIVIAKELVSRIRSGDVAPEADCSCRHPWLCRRTS